MKDKSKPIDLHEYEEEAVPFDTVIRRLGAAKQKPVSKALLKRRKSPPKKK